MTSTRERKEVKRLPCPFCGCTHRTVHAVIAVTDEQITQVDECVIGQHVWFVHEGSGDKICSKCGQHREWLVRKVIADSANVAGSPAISKAEGA